jgi:hypothetical protein
LIDDYRPFGLNNQADEPLIQLTPERLQWLKALDQTPSPLLQHLKQTQQQRLGLYFEALWHFFLQQDSQIDLIANNLPVRDQHRTLGEFDLILFCKQRQQYFHLELAVKFYLYANHYCTEESQLAAYSQWLGPNCRDRFDRKLHHLTQQQIQLSKTERGKEVLADLGITDIDTHIALKGSLFYPGKNNAIKNPQLTEKHRQGQWLCIEDAKNELPKSPFWQILGKPDWISPSYYPDNQNLLNKEALLEKLDQLLRKKNQPIMICALQEFDGGYIEQQRFFITDKLWPQSLLNEN